MSKKYLTYQQSSKLALKQLINYIFNCGFILSTGLKSILKMIYETWTNYTIIIINLGSSVVCTSIISRGTDKTLLPRKMVIHSYFKAITHLI